MRCREHHSVGWLHFCWQSIKYAASGSPILQDEEESNPLALLQPMLVFSQAWRPVTKHPFSATAGGGADRGCLKFSARWECFTGDRRTTEGSWTSVCNIISILIKKILGKNIASTCNIFVALQPACLFFSYTFCFFSFFFPPQAYCQFLIMTQMSSVFTHNNVHDILGVK